MISHDMEVKRGDVFYADLLQDQIGSVQAGIRPVVIKQGNWLNRTSTTYGVVLITSRLKNTGMATHVLLPKLKGLPKQSMVLGEQQTTVDRKQLVSYRCTLPDETMKQVDRAIRCADSSKEHWHKKRKR